MLEPPEADRRYVVLPRQGAQPEFDFSAIATELARLQTGTAELRLLFDWISVKSWFKSPSASDLLDWNNTLPLIRRAAIVYTQKCYRQAAMLSALLRLANAEVRSFHHQNIDLAITWLERDV